jgi:hypothetical protein
MSKEKPARIAVRGLSLRESEALRAKAKQDYIHAKYRSRKEQAAAYGVTPAVLWRWFRYDEWESARQDYQETVCAAANPVNQKHIQVWEALAEQVIRRLVKAKQENVLLDTRTLHALSVTFARVQTGVRTALGMDVPRSGDRSLGEDDLAIFLERLSRDDERARVLQRLMEDKNKSKLAQYELEREDTSKEPPSTLEEVLPEDPAAEALKVLAQPSPANGNGWSVEPPIKGSGFSEGVFSPKHLFEDSNGKEKHNGESS